MLPLSTIRTLLVIICTRRAFAQLTPTTPGPNETYSAGSNCTIAWVPDTSGSWKNVTIDLMSGSNNNMSLVANVVVALDGTDKTLTPFSWTCPEVDPYSAIYFYQFTNGDNTTSRTWTTRFTIASPSNDTKPPDNSQQPNGDSVAWGIGHLKDSKSASNSSMSSTSSSPMVQSTNVLPSASASAAPANGKKPHGHKTHDTDATSQSDPDDDDDEGGKDNGDENDDSTGKPSKTRTANIGAAKSAAARATAIARTHSSSSSDSAEPEASDKPANDDAGSNSDGGEQAQSSVPGSTPGYKNSGAADAADSARAAGCQCEDGTDREKGDGARLEVSVFMSLIVTPVAIALVVLLL